MEIKECYISKPNIIHEISIGIEIILYLSIIRSNPLCRNFFSYQRTLRAMSSPNLIKDKNN